MQSPTTNRPPLGLGKLIRRGLAAFVIVLLLLFAGARYNLRRQLNAELDRIRAAGQPVTLIELDQQFRDLGGRPDHSKELHLAITEVTAIYQRFETNGIPGTSVTIQDLPLFGAGKTKTLVAGQALPPEIRNALARALTELGPALDKLSEVIGQSDHAFRHSLAMTNGMLMLMPHLSPLKRTWQWLSLRSAYELDSGNAEPAIGAIIDGFRLSRTLESEPTLISQLVRLAMLRTALNSVERLLAFHSLTQEQAGKLRGELNASRPDRAMHIGMQGERCMGLEAMQAGSTNFFTINSQFNEPTSSGVAARAMMQLYRMSGLADRDMAFYLRKMNTVVTVATNSIPKRVALANDPATFDPGSHKKFYILSSMLLPALNKALLKEADCLTAIAAADAALALEAFRADNSGRIPSSLSELVPVYFREVPIDPATEKPLTIFPASTGYVIHGAGPLFTVRR